MEASVNALMRRGSTLVSWNVQSKEELRHAITKGAAERKAAEGLEEQILTACRMIQAQFRLNHIILDQGTFYFQWVHTGKEAKRDPKQPIQKVLYLVFVKDLTCWDDDLSKRAFSESLKLSYHADPLTGHFYRLVLEHHELKLKEPGHTDLCSCRIQTDTNAEVQKKLKEICAALSSQDPRRFDAQKMEALTLGCFCYLLRIKDDLLTKARAAGDKRARTDRLVQIQEDRSARIYLGESRARCPFCDNEFSMTDLKQYSVPLEQLIYLPNQEKFFKDHCAGLPQRQKLQVLAANKDLPLFLRLLLPGITSPQEYRQLQRKRQWLEQRVILSKYCHSSFLAYFRDLAR